MTKKQRREHKIGNQKRKKLNMYLARHSDDIYQRSYYAKMRVPQDGKYTT